MNKNKLRSTIVTLIVVATVLIGMIFGATADSGNVPNAPEPRLTISTADASLTSMHDDWHYMVGRDMSEGRRLNRINPDMDVTHPERFERFSGRSDISRDMPDWLIDSRMNRTMSRTGTPDRSAPDRLAGKNMAYQKVSDSDIPLVMSATTSSECSFTYGITAGDLNGDDLADVLVFSGTYNSTTYAYTFESVSAVNGDGAELWSQSIVYEAGWIGDIPAYPVGDLDGDNKNDVIVNSRSYDSTTDEYTCTVYAKRGYDGDEFWSQSITDEDAYMWAYSYCDLNGDGKDDVIVESESYDSTTDEYTCTVYAKRGYDGDEFWSQSITGEDAYMWAYSYCDLNGDGKDDVIVESESYDSTTDEYTCTVYAKRGYDGDEFWSQSITGEDASLEVSSYCDLDDDGKDDVIVESESYDSVTDEYTCTVYAKRGYDGNLFWSQSITGDGWEYTWVDSVDIGACPCGDLDGDGKDDVIVGSKSYDSTTDEYTCTVYVKRGYDGDEFWSQSLICGSWAYMHFSYCDLNGDGKDDVIVGSWNYDSGTDKETVSVYAKRGYDGNLFWSQSITGEDAFIYPLSCCDLNGDGKDDVIIESNSRSHDSAPNVYTIYAKRGYDGNLFWSQSATGTGAYLRASLYCDLNGDDKDDVIVESRNYDSATNDYTIGVYARRGYDGNLFWSQDIVRESWWYDVYMWAYSYCDLDGDDKDDVIVESESYDSGTDETTCTVYAKRGYDGDEFWNQCITGEDLWMETDYYNWYYYSSQDFDGDSLDDLLITTGISSDYNEIPTKVCAVKGNDGTSLWCKSSEPPVTGDLNGDGKLTPADAVIALNIAVRGEYDADADVNNDGSVTSLDALMILQAAAGSITL